ncbi:hypothetical protein [Desulfonatronovibrio hydrogenovorans]|uniref:hypothetical protein n=1 Tax=Desulfonatronovibrio hydrogenovorans TaxID=53245 RepID=UPI0012377F0D|nr:hypothetical protein [Desulfonatronovibrio hydrogenovorans]
MSSKFARFHRKISRLIINDTCLDYGQKAKLFNLLAWNGPDAAWHEYEELRCKIEDRPKRKSTPSTSWSASKPSV